MHEENIFIYEYCSQTMFGWERGKTGTENINTLVADYYLGEHTSEFYQQARQFYKDTNDYNAATHLWFEHKLTSGVRYCAHAASIFLLGVALTQPVRRNALLIAGTIQLGNMYTAFIFTETSRRKYEKDFQKQLNRWLTEHSLEEQLGIKNGPYVHDDNSEDPRDW
jgi:hypothetical protein